MRNRVLLTPSQTTRTAVKSTTIEYKNDPEINKIQYVWPNSNWWAMQSKPKWEKGEKNMNQSKQETHLKLTCKNNAQNLRQTATQNLLLCSLEPLCQQTATKNTSPSRKLLSPSKKKKTLRPASLKLSLSQIPRPKLLLSWKNSLESPQQPRYLQLKENHPPGSHVSLTFFSL